MQSALSFVPLRPVGFVNFHGAGQGRAGQGLLFAGRGSLFFHGAGRSSLIDVDSLQVPYLYIIYHI